MYSFKVLKRSREALVCLTTEGVYIIMTVSVIIGFVYKLKLSEILDAFANGVEKTYKTALLIAFAMIIVIITIHIAG